VGTRRRVANAATEVMFVDGGFAQV
jgi:hypothetical protein